jgi:predicted O-methyltransferase YrrM
MSKRSLSVKVLHRLARAATGLAAGVQRKLRQRELADASLSSALAIPTHMTAGELNVLYDLAVNAPQGAKALEIGSYLGASSCHLAAGLSRRDGQLTCVDTWANETMPEGERDTFAEFRRNTSGAGARIATIRKRSDELTAADVTPPFDLVFIDADHTYPAVKRDVEIVGEWLRDGGVLAFHDAVYFEGVSRVVGEILATGKWQMMGNVDNLVWLRKLGRTGAFPNPMADGEYVQR